MAAHVLIGGTSEIQYETDREKFLGRGNAPDAPAALRQDLTGSVGTVLDPIFSLRCRATIEPCDRLELSFVTDTGGNCHQARSVPLVRELLRAHTYWRLGGFRADFIILNQEIPSYDRFAPVS